MPQQEQIDKLSKKDCIENIKLFKIEIKKAEDFIGKNYKPKLNIILKE